MADGLSRRSILQGLAATAATVGTVSLSAAPASAAAAAPNRSRSRRTPTGRHSTRRSRSAFDRMNMVGAALALVSAGEVLHTTTLGSRMLAPRRPVTTTDPVRQRVDGQVDDGGVRRHVRRRRHPRLGPARGGCLVRVPGAHRRAHPHPARARPDRDGLRPGRTALDVEPLRRCDRCPAAAVGGQPPRRGLARGHRPSSTTTRCTPSAGTCRCWPPASRRPTWAPRSDAGHPRAAVHPGRYARGDPRLRSSRAQRRLRGRPPSSTCERAPGRSRTRRSGPTARPGPGIVNIEDMAAWVRLQLRQGVSVNGRRVVSAANLAECWKPHVPASLLPPELDPDAVSVGYAMGWIRRGVQGRLIPGLAQRRVRRVHGVRRVPAAARPGTDRAQQHDRRSGRHLVLHLRPQPGVERAVRAQRRSAGQGRWPPRRRRWTTSADARIDRPSRSASRSWRPYLGYYEGGYSLVREGRDVVLHNSSRAVPAPGDAGRELRDVRRVHGRGSGEAAPGRPTAPHTSRSSESRRCAGPPAWASAPPLTTSSGGLLPLSGQKSSARAGRQRYWPVPAAPGLCGPPIWPGTPWRGSSAAG